MPALSLIIPTLNEHDNLLPLISKIKSTLEGVDWEVVFVDDASHDGTIEEILRLNGMDSRIRFIERINRRGLSSACIEGIMTSSAPLVAVMDADHQHDETLLCGMLDIMRDQSDIDLVIASRFVDGGGVGDWNRQRLALSYLGRWLSGHIFPPGVSDPMSGFFMVRRQFFWRLAPQIHGRGFKILVDMLASSKGDCKFVELPYQFGRRHSGESKLSFLVGTEFVELVVDKTFGRFLPARLIRFIMVSGFGMLIHLAMLSALHLGAEVTFWKAQVVSAFFVIFARFSLSYLFTYSDHMFRWGQAVLGLLSFCVFCSGGLLINMSIALNIYDRGGSWMLAGALGGVVGAVWNYSTSTSLTWRGDNP
jgi:dolichol-phosphate mannosyltransferase